MKKRFIEKYSIAIVILIAVVLLTTLASGGVSLSRQRARTERIFTEGENRDGLSVSYDLGRRTESAYNLAGLAKRYLGEEDERVTALLSARETLVSAEGISEKYSANLELTVAADALYSALKDEELSQKDSSLAAEQYQDMLSRNDTISRSGYNAAAARFNGLLKKFPAGLIAAAVGIKPLETFN